MHGLTFFTLTSHPVTPLGPQRLGQIRFSVNPTMSPPKVSSNSPLRPLPFLPPTILGASPLARKVDRGAGSVGGGGGKGSCTPRARRLGSSSVFSPRAAGSPLARDPKPSSTRATAAQRFASSTSSVSRNGEQAGQVPRKLVHSSRDLGSKPALKRNTVLVNTDRMVRKVSSPASSRFLSRTRSGPTSTSSPAQQPVQQRSPASGLRSRRLTDAHETPPSLSARKTQQQEEEEEEEESPLKLQEELLGIGRQLGGLARRIDLCNSQDKENVEKLIWNEEDAATHSDELSRYLPCSIYRVFFCTSTPLKS